jgi:CRISPR-associated endonuclease/helicase Cas3
MSATLPELLITKIKEISSDQAEIVEVRDESEVRTRKNRRVTLHTKPLKNKIEISASEIKNIYSTSKNKKLIVVVNTVEKAQEVYRELIKDNLDAKLLLIHSRFLDEDRKEKENLLQQIFDEKNKEHAILISTQVIEVGVDISSPTIISEVAPIDSLIQRAGRCARRGGEGDFYVYDVKDYAPYNKEIVEKTKEELIKADGEVFSWDLERELVNKILPSYYKAILDDSIRSEIIGRLARAIFCGERSKVEECVRDAFTCNVSIYDNPQELCNEKNDIFRLQKINVNVWVFRSKAEKLLESGVKIWSVEESNILDDYSLKFAPVVISDTSEILPFKHYIVSPEGAYYDKDVGLIFGDNRDKGRDKGLINFTLSENESIENKEKEFIRKYDPWVNHAIETLNILDKRFIPRYDFIISKFSEAFGINKKDLIKKIRIAVALHDIGKLNKYWQEKIGWDGKIPLAHSNKVDVTRIGIPHATVSAKALSSLYNELGEASRSLLLAIAHHHSPYSQEYKPYEFISNWKAIVEELSLEVSLKNIIDKRKTSDKLEFSIPYLGYENSIIPYRFYAFVSKILRLSDWIAACGEEQWSIM